jgi:hypothetical protein
MAIPQSMKDALPYDTAILLLSDLSKGNEISIWKGHLSSHVYFSSIHNSQEMESVHQLMHG